MSHFAYSAASHSALTHPEHLDYDAFYLQENSINGKHEREVA
jgi:hypothetical protein